MKTSSNFIILAILFVVLATVSGHARWKCPLPRDANDDSGNHIKFDNTGNKVGACGPQSGKYGYGTITKLSPGWTTLVWEESISHTGSPFRLALLDETETARIILLDHIPHDDAATPNYLIEETYQPYKMSVNIPNVSCEKCTLQLLYVMTDKSTKCGAPLCYYNPADSACKGSTDPAAGTCAGAPNDQTCVDENECFSNYHSCTDVSIDGELDLSTFSLDGQPSDWPYQGANYKMQYYALEASTWQDNWLAGIPSNYTTEYDSLTC